MGCDASTFVVKNNIIPTFDYHNWWQARPNFPLVNNKKPDVIAPYIENPNLFIWIYEKCNLNKIKEFNNDGWCVIEINKNNIDILQNKCKELILPSLELETEKDFKKSVFCDFYYCEDISERLCFMYREIKYIKSVLEKYPEHSIIANINY